MTKGNFGTYPMSNDLTRLQTRFLGTPEHVATLQDSIGAALEAAVMDFVPIFFYFVRGDIWALLP